MGLLSKGVLRLIKKLSYFVVSIVLLAIGSGNQLPYAVEAERVELNTPNRKGELIR